MSGRRASALARHWKMRGIMIPDSVWHACGLDVRLDVSRGLKVAVFACHVRGRAFAGGGGRDDDQKLTVLVMRRLRWARKTRGGRKVASFACHVRGLVRYGGRK